MAIWQRIADGTTNALAKVRAPASITTADNAVATYDPTVAGKLPTLGPQASAASMSVVPTSAGFPVTGTMTGTVTGSVTANAGTNLNTSALALEAGGHLEEAADHAHNIDASAASIALGVWLDPSATHVDHLHFDASQQTGTIAAGKYVVCATEHCFVRTGATSGLAATADDFRLPKDTMVGILLSGTNDAIAAIKETTAGILSVSKVG
jgi:hypothetical protein